MFFYLHIPFCRQKCRYCKFALTPKFDELKIRTYIDALKREIEAFFQETPFYSPLSGGQEWSPPDKGGTGSLQSIYLGGGTPSILTVEQIAEIFEVFQLYSGEKIPPTPLSQGGKIEITLESNPEDITEEYLAGIAGLGVNRLSLGIQTMNSESLRMTGRADSNESIFRALDVIASGPIENISIDLIAGLPATVSGQAVSDLTEIFSRITPKHASIYMLENESYPLDWKHYLPNEETIWSEYLSGMEWLESKGFRRYELSNFAKPGFESKHNRSYWNHSEYRGFGLSAASFINGERFTNSSSFIGYYRGEKQSKDILSSDLIRIERIMFGMRTGGVSLDDIGNREMLDLFVEDGLLERDKNKVFPTSTWIFLIDYIIGELI